MTRKLLVPGFMVTEKVTKDGGSVVAEKDTATGGQKIQVLGMALWSATVRDWVF